MIRAILTNGTIQPLDCLPADWVEGQELRVDPVERPRESAEDIDRWYQELESLCTAGDPDDERRLQAALAEAHEQARAVVRRQMGLE